MSVSSFDAIVIGGGPSGSAAAGMLGLNGHKTLILEKDAFPRYRIGESLLPYCYFPLQKLGLVDAMKKSDFVRKHSVQFVSKSGKLSSPFYFQGHMQHEAAETWQVERHEFDQMMVNRAIELGAEFRQNVQVMDLLQDEHGKVVGVKARDAEGNVHEHYAPLTIDASGRNALSASRMRWRMMDPKLKKIAIWSYFKGAVRDEGIDEGATTVAYLDGKNWFWYIPLRNNIVSVGLVGDKSFLYETSRDPETVFKSKVEQNLWIKEHLAPSERVRDFQQIGDFSFRSRYCATDGLVLTGDAFSFLDPVFSSGLFVALQGGVMAGEAASAALAKGDVSAPQFETYGQQLREALENMRRLVYAFYDPDFNFKDLFKKYPDLHGDVTDCLIGDLNKDFSKLFNAVGEFAQLPEPSEYGVPLAAIS